MEKNNKLCAALAAAVAGLLVNAAGVQAETGAHNPTKLPKQIEIEIARNDSKACSVYSPSPPLNNGDFVRVNGQNEVYFLSKNRRHWVTDSATLDRLLRGRSVKLVDYNSLQQWQFARPITTERTMRFIATGNPEEWVIYDGKRHFISADVVGGYENLPLQEIPSNLLNCWEVGDPAP